jgi:hypothetical protein
VFGEGAEHDTRGACAPRVYAHAQSWAWIVMVPFAACAALGAESEFMRDVEVVSGRCLSTVQDADKAALAGDMARASQLLLGLIERDKSPPMAFLVANYLFRADPNISYRLHKIVYDAMPAEPDVIVEMAIEMHRKQEYKRAGELYGEYLAKAQDKKMHALRADCLVREGQLAQAAAEWIAAKHSTNHTEIDYSIFQVYGELSPLQRRSQLLTKVKAGEDGAIDDLILLDCHFDNDWWTAEVNKRALPADLKLAADKLGDKSPRYLALKTYAGLQQRDELSAADARAALKKVDLICGPSGKLPENSKLAWAMAEVALRSGAESRSGLLKVLEPSLLERAKSEKGDSEALRMLCQLASGSDKEKLIGFGRYGWERYSDPRFAIVFLNELLARKELKPDDADLKAALAKAPENNELNMLRVRALVAAGKDLDADTVVSAIKAEYRHFSNGVLVPDSYMLKDLFLTLDELLKKPK